MGHLENCAFGLDYPSLKMTQTINFYSSINMFLFHWPISRPGKH